MTRLQSDGLRRAAPLAREPAQCEDAAGVVVLAADGSTRFVDAVARAWMEADGSVRDVVTSVASRARTVATHAGRLVRARVQAESGRWLVVRVSALGDGPDAQIAVMIELARPDQLAPLVADACRLTAREREVTRLVARGLPTSAIAARLYMSSWTVQDHLKAIFEKVGVTTRGELVSRLFFQQQVPEL